MIFEKMTRREREVLDLLITGKTNKQIAQILGVSAFTVRDHVSSVLRKTGKSNRLELVQFAMTRLLSEK